MNKPFLPMLEQIQLLRERDLIINDDKDAIDLLSLHSYYSVINGYKDIFLCPDKTEYYGEDRFKEDVNLKDIISLFTLDIELRKEILSTLEVIESILSNNIAYILGERYGHIKEDYLNERIFRKGRLVRVEGSKRVFEVDILFQHLNRSYNSSKYPMKHYRNKYGNVPPWVLVKGLTFRNLYYVYKLFKYEDKNYLISRCLGIEEEQTSDKLKEFFNKALDLMIYYRNWAAHGNRIFSHKTETELPFYEPIYKMCGLSIGDYRKRIGKNDLFALSIAVKFFLQIDPPQARTYHVLITYYLIDYRDKNDRFFDLLLKSMGFPQDHHELITGIDEKAIAYSK